ncbi:DNA-binding transcriptional LysR family regulator [Sedimentibacter acidaminivorans]|uniref:DNA-binding transcriptional LysR family regulator n=1 Tax=Sedimentibacter acidaminivorans TaxID=913099 RepID=A0ABS4GEB7_9FIRM|nr:LysR substrate-binding domain-containing protein [Sedimentibacter acidaminivorans]MBP1925982.1 DNA-binding transcriptional LysR family regulator [Sedimentibacter acidaminivorans]
MNLQQLYYFKTIAEYEQYTKASKALIVSQPTLSHSISDLENELGVPLFYKKGRNIKLTKYGSTFLVFVTEALEKIELGKYAIKEMINPDEGIVSLSFVSSLSTHFIPYVVKQFYEDEQNLQIKFEYDQNTSQKIITGLNDGKFDIGFGSKMEAPELEFYNICEEEMALVVSNKHQWANRESVELSEIVDQKLITYEHQCGTRIYVDNILSVLNKKPKIVSEVSNDTMVAGIVSANMGIAIMPKMFGLNTYDVKAIRIENCDSKRNLYMIWHKNRFMSPVAKKFRDYIVENIKFNSIF